MSRPSKKATRQSRILTALDSNPALRVNDLAAEFDVSAETIRRDLSELEEDGRITRTYGGAVRTQLSEPALSERLKLFVAERQRIAQTAIGLLDDTCVIFVGGGATALHFARALRQTTRPLQVITPAFSVAMELASNPQIGVMALPGLVEAREGLVHGAETIASIRKYRPGVAIVGASGITSEGVSEALMTAAQVYGSMIDNSERTLVLADRSKFGHRALQIIAGWSPRIKLVSDAGVEGPLADVMRQSGTEQIVARDLADV